MQCPNCHYENAEGKFCVKCGTKLPEAEASQFQQPYHNQGNNQAGYQYQNQGPNQGQYQYQNQGPNQGQYQYQYQGQYQNPYQGQYQQQPVQPNPQFEAAKRVSKNYFSHFVNAIKYPYAYSSTVGKNQFINSFITMILYSIFIPFAIYFSIGDDKDWMVNPFLNIVFKPFLVSVIVVFLIGVFSFVALKIEKVSVDFQSVIGRTGSFLIPFVVLNIIIFLLYLMDVDFIGTIVQFSVYATIFTVPALVLASYRNQPSPFDKFYSAILVYILIFVSAYLLGEMMGDEVYGNIFGYLL